MVKPLCERMPQTAAEPGSEISSGPEVTSASYPDGSCTGAVDSDAVPKDLDRMIDAALDRGAEVLWDDAGHRAAMQVTADRVEELNGRELGIIEAD